MTSSILQKLLSRIAGSAQKNASQKPLGNAPDLIALASTVGPVLFGSPVVLCGSVVKGKPTFTTLGNFGIVSIGPPKPVIYISSEAKHYVNIGIRENKEFSVCFPHPGIMAQTDYCGVLSGHKTDKSGIFQVQYGTLKKAPMAKECNICFTCSVLEQTHINSMDVFFAEIVEKYGSAECVVNAKPRPDAIRPVAFGPGNAYRVVDAIVGTPWSDYRKISQ